MGAMYYRIDLPCVCASALDKLDGPFAVTPKSPVQLRRVVERFAIYFRREFAYDFQRFEAGERPPVFEKPYAAYLFTNERNSHPRVWTGACCFRWRKYADVGDRWAMQWMWLHSVLSR
jgi:hypothetical protein